MDQKLNRKINYFIFSSPVFQLKYFQVLVVFIFSGCEFNPSNLIPAPLPASDPVPPLASTRRAFRPAADGGHRGHCGQEAAILDFFWLEAEP